MFPDSSVIVQSAASSFNNLALRGAEFFWSALLAAPVFTIVWIFAEKIAEKIKSLTTTPGAHNSAAAPSPAKGIAELLVIFSGVLLFIWLLVHGNYQVVRDGVSWISIGMAVVLFLLSVFLSFHLGKQIVERIKKLSPPTSPRGDNSPAPLKGGIKDDANSPFQGGGDRYRRRGDVRKFYKYALPAIVIAAIGLAGAPSVLGFIMQAGAVVLGALLGRRLKKAPDPMVAMSLVMFFVTFLIAMQPEFFRFGQLGRLTGLHLGILVLSAISAAAAFAFLYFNPRGKFHESVAKKIKLLGVMAAGLMLILFLFTESSLMLLAFAAICALTFILSVKHFPKNTPVQKTGEALFAIQLAAFGIMTGMVAITCAAIVLWRSEKMAVPKLKNLL